MNLILLEGEEETGGRGNLSVGKLTSTVHYKIINPLIAELNPICHLLALLGAHNILHVRRIRVKVSITRTMDGGECSTHRRNEKRMQIFHWDTLDGKYNFADIRCMVG
jgi:hypothetical protein